MDSPSLTISLISRSKSSKPSSKDLREIFWAPSALAAKPATLRQILPYLEARTMLILQELLLLDPHPDDLPGHLRDLLHACNQIALFCSRGGDAGALESLQDLPAYANLPKEVHQCSPIPAKAPASPPK